MRIRAALLAAAASVLLLGLSGCSAGSNDPQHIDSYDARYTIAQSGVVHAVETIH